MTDTRDKIASAWASIRSRWDPRKHGPRWQVHFPCPIPLLREWQAANMLEAIPVDAVEFRLSEVRRWCDDGDIRRWRDVIGEYQGQEAVVGWFPA